MKKIIALILCFLMILSVCSIPAFAENNIVASGKCGDATYNISKIIKTGFRDFKTLIYVFFTKIAGSLSLNFGNKYSTGQLKCTVVDVNDGKIVVTPNADDDLYGRIDTIVFKENSAIDETSYKPKKGDSILVMYNYKSLHRINNQWTISIVFAIYEN